MLEYAVEFIADDELVGVTPQFVRIRKRAAKRISASALRSAMPRGRREFACAAA